MLTEIDSYALLHLLQLASPALPVGAYSYSEGLETLCSNGEIADEQDLQQWLLAELNYGAIRMEAAVMIRAYTSASAADLERLTYWNNWLSATRETKELRASSWQMGDALLRLLRDLKSPSSQPKSLEKCIEESLYKNGCNFAIAFGIAASSWQIDRQSALLCYLHSWATNLIGAGVKLIPLGQTAGQQLLLSLSSHVSSSSPEILQLLDDDLQACGWGLSLASMNHETLYSRLFRS
jgi:urease accessory protein